MQPFYERNNLEIACAVHHAPPVNCQDGCRELHAHVSRLAFHQMYLEFDLVKQRLTKKLWAESEALRRIAPQRLACLKAKRATNARSGRALASPGYQKASKDSGLYRAYLLVDIYKGNRKRLNLLTLSTPAASFAVRSV